MHSAGGNDEAITRFYVPDRLGLDDQIALAFHDVADLFAKMRVTSDRSSGSKLHSRDDGLLSPRDVMPLHDRTVHGGVLSQKSGAQHKYERQV